MAIVGEICTTGEPWLPPLFSNEEWREIIDALSLSPRQAQIVGLLIQGRKDKEIGAALSISKSTVRTHLIETKARMAAEDRVGLAYRVFWTFREIVEPKRYPWAHRDGR